MVCNDTSSHTFPPPPPLEDGGLQFINALLPVPSVYEAGLPNRVEWYMDEEAGLGYLQVWREWGGRGEVGGARGGSWSSQAI